MDFKRLTLVIRLALVYFSALVSAGECTHLEVHNEGTEE